MLTELDMKLCRFEQCLAAQQDFIMTYNGFYLNVTNFISVFFSGGASLNNRRHKELI